MKNRLALSFIMILLIGIIGCGAGPAAGEFEVQDAWGRTSPKVAHNGAFYMKLVNNSSEDEQLLSAATEACDVVELHEMYKMENDAMGMRPVEGGVISIPAGEMVELKAGGLHVMCIGKTADFNVGDVYPVTLTFAEAGEMEVDVEIRETADMGSGG